MSTTPTSARARDEETASLKVVIAVVHFDEGDTAAALDGVGRQGYEADAVVLVGGGEPGRALAAARSIPHEATVGELVARLGPDVDLVWILHGDAVPRPDALGALVFELDRNEASLVGSKILDVEVPDRLESVGGATDMFGEIYLGIDPGEVDLEQYDVVRDVAFVSGVSFLARRDLLKGLGGIDPKLPPVAAGLDLSQRARLAGGRVMVAPSSEVFHARACRHDVAGWRELAGRMRAMLKAYRLVTLAWLVPAGLAVGLGEGIVRLVLGQWRPLAEYVAALGWSFAELPSTFRESASLAPVRRVGDEELFRYQTSGSVRLRDLATDLGQRLGWIVDEEPGVVTEEELESEASLLGPLTATLVVLFLAVGFRGLLFGPVPGSRFTAPPSDDPAGVLAAFAGGWNPAGLGGPGSPHPAPAALAAVQWLLGGWAGVTELLTAAAVVGGVAGTARLLHRLGVTGPSRFSRRPRSPRRSVRHRRDRRGVLGGPPRPRGRSLDGDRRSHPGRRPPRRPGRQGRDPRPHGNGPRRVGPGGERRPRRRRHPRLDHPPRDEGRGPRPGSGGGGVRRLRRLPLPPRGASPGPVRPGSGGRGPSRRRHAGSPRRRRGRCRPRRGAVEGRRPRLGLAAAGLAVGAAPALGGEGSVAGSILGSLGGAIVVGSALHPASVRRRWETTARLLGAVAAVGLVATTAGVVPAGRAGLGADVLERPPRLRREPRRHGGRREDPSRFAGPGSLPGSIRIGNGYA